MLLVMRLKARLEQRAGYPVTPFCSDEVHSFEDKTQQIWGSEPFFGSTR